MPQHSTRWKNPRASRPYHFIENHFHWVAEAELHATAVSDMPGDDAGISGCRGGCNPGGVSATLVDWEIRQVSVNVEPKVLDQGNWRDP